MTPARDLPVRVDLPDAEDEAVRRFADDLDWLWLEGRRDAEARIGLAVSGGPDSLALLILAAAAFPGRIEASTVDHGLRAESAAEADFVARLCAHLYVPHRACAVEVAAGNVQSQARAARYAALAGWAEERNLSAIATAHHADDQAETLLLRLNRASGVSGLAGARARGPVPGARLPLLRPLLDWRRSELAQIAVRAGVTAIQDPSNVDDRFDRVRLRKALATADWLNIEAIAQSASHLADADVALDWAAAREWDACVRTAPFGLVYKPVAPRAIALRVVARIVRELDGQDVRGGSIALAFDSLMSGQPVSIGNLVARPGPAGWSFSKAPQRRQK